MYNGHSRARDQQGRETSLMPPGAVSRDRWPRYIPWPSFAAHIPAPCRFDVQFDRSASRGPVWDTHDMEGQLRPIALQPRLGDVFARLRKIEQRARQPFYRAAEVLARAGGGILIPVVPAGASPNDSLYNLPEEAPRVPPKGTGVPDWLLPAGVLAAAAVAAMAIAARK